MTNEPSKQYWYNMKTGEVEFGFESPSANRVGPFPTEHEASHALEKLQANSARWAAEDAAENG